MKKEQLFEAIGGADEKFLDYSERGGEKYRIKKNCLKAAACFMAAVLSIFVLNAEKNKIPLSDISKGVKAKYIDKAPKIKKSYSLEYFTEEELFFKFDVVILKGTVKKLNNIQLNFNGERAYRAIAEIEVQKVYRGDCQENEIISVLLPCSIGNGIWTEDTETISAMQVGMTGIFMPIMYDETFIWKQNGAELREKDIADYGFLDGSRYAFLETEQGLIFARYAYPSIADVTALEEVEKYIEDMIN